MDSEGKKSFNCYIWNPLDSNQNKYQDLFDEGNHVNGLTLGTFDGLHLGHQTLVKRLKDELKSYSFKNSVANTILISFYPHPRSILGNPVIRSKYKKLITPLKTRNFLLERMGINFHVALKFSKLLSELPAEDFINKIVLVFRPKVIVVGFDWCFGKNREGNIDLLKSFGHKYKFDVVVVGEVTSSESHKIGASSIRSLIEIGNPKDLIPILGRKFSLFGKVIKGDGRGRKIGFRTANIKTSNQQLMPKEGVYKTSIIVDGLTFKSITNVGKRPTFNSVNELTVIETHIFDFEKEIYGANVELEFEDFIREEKKFNSANDLIQQIQQDILKLNG